MGISFDIPGKGHYSIENIVFDLNGTLGVDGELRSTTFELLSRLSERVHAYILTADTHNSASLLQEHFQVIVLSGTDTTFAKRDFIKEIGRDHTAAVGNGANDAAMLEESLLGIAVVEEEGCSAKILGKADILIRNIDDAIKLFLNPRRLKATLRR